MVATTPLGSGRGDDASKELGSALTCLRLPALGLIEPRTVFVDVVDVAGLFVEGEHGKGADGDGAGIDGALVDCDKWRAGSVRFILLG